MSLGDPRALLNSERSRRKTMTLQLPLAALSTVNVVDTKYDSDSDFDYRPKPPRYRVNSRNRKTCPGTLIGPKLLSMEMPIPSFCSWNRYGDSMSRSSEFEIPIEFRIPNFCPWKRHGKSMSRSSEFGIPYPFLTFLGK